MSSPEPLVSAGSESDATALRPESSPLTPDSEALVHADAPSPEPDPPGPPVIRFVRIPGADRLRIEEAIRIIDGAKSHPSGSPDYVLAPAEHAELYEQSAPELAERLRRSDLRVTAESYQERDRKAGELRVEFEKKSARARVAVLVASVAAALLVGSAGLAAVLDGTPTLLRFLVIGLSIVAVSASSLAAGWIQSVRGGSLLERWMKVRAEAETERQRYFELLTAGPPLENPLLQLEYFRRYQLDVQRAYYTRRGDDQRRAADRRIQVVSAATAVAGIAAGVSGFLGAAVALSWTSLAALGLVAQAFSASAENRQTSEQSLRNAERYEQTRVSLTEFYRLLDAVRNATAVARGDEDLAVMRQYVAAVQDRLALEHRQWLDDTRLAGEAVARLEELLEDSRRTVTDRGGAGQAS
jgi:hypothetical protein